MTWKWFAALGFFLWVASGIIFAITIAILIYRDDEEEL